MDRLIFYNFCYNYFNRHTQTGYETHSILWSVNIRNIVCNYTFWENWEMEVENL